MLIVFVVASILLIGSAHGLLRSNGAPRLNAVTVIGPIWILAIGLLMIPGWSGPGLALATGAFSFLLLAGIASGATLGHMFIGPRQPQGEDFHYGRLGRLHRNLTVLLCLFAIYDTWRLRDVIRALGGFSAIWSNTGHSFRSQVVLLRIESIHSGINLGESVLGYVLFLGNLSVVTGAILWRRGWRLRGSLPLVILGIYSLASLQRTTFILGAIMFVVTSVTWSSAGPHARSPLLGAKVLFVRAALLAVGAAALLVPATIRNRGTDDATGLDSLVEYVVSGLAGMNLRNLAGLPWEGPYNPVTGVQGSVPGHGIYTFGGWFQLANRFGLTHVTVPSTKEYLYPEWHGSAYATNTVTSAGDFLLDFGVAGVFLAPFVIALVATVLQKAARGRSPAAIGPSSVVLTGIAWSFFGSAVWGDVRYGFLAVVSYFLLRGATVRSPGEWLLLSTVNRVAVSLACEPVNGCGLDRRHSSKLTQVPNGTQESRPLLGES